VCAPDANATETSRTYAGGANRSHPVGFKDAARTIPLTLAAAGTGNDPTYANAPLDSAMKLRVAAPANASVITLDPAYKLATNALQNFVVRFTSGAYRNVQVRVSWNAVGPPSTLTIAPALPTAPAVGDTFEVDRVGSPDAYDVTANVGTVADQIQDASKSWPPSAS